MTQHTRPQVSIPAGGAENCSLEKPWLKFYEDGVPHTLSFADVPLDTMLRESARKYPAHPATNFVLKYLFKGLFTVGGSLSYRQLDDLVDRFATALYHIGVRKGDRVALMMPNSPQFLIAFFAAMRLGAILVNINPTYTSREMLLQISDSGAETIILLNLFWRRLREIQTQTNLKRVVVSYIFDLLPPVSQLLVRSSQRRDPDWVDVKPEHDIFYFEHLVQRYDPNPPKVEVNAQDIALFQYTGGTTGTPKAAMLTHYNVMANVTQIAAWLPDGKPGNEKMMAAIPFFHVYGLAVCMLYGVYLGYELIIVPNPRPIENVMRIIQHEQCTLFPGVPAMYIGIVNHPKVREYNLKSVRACISGSAPLPMEVQEKFGLLTGGRLVEGYGLSEASPVTHCNPVYGQRKAGSIGIPLPNVEARIVSLETGSDQPFDGQSQGEMYVRGPQVMSSYWNRSEDTAVTITPDGWLRTGDICTADPNGYFSVVDRKKDMMIVSGFKVLPREVEEVLFMHPKVMEAIVAGIPHPTRGDDTVKAYIVTLPGDEPTVEELREFCRGYLAPYKIPREFEFRTEVPRTIVGKILRRVLVEEELARQQRDNQTVPAEAPEQVRG